MSFRSISSRLPLELWYNICDYLFHDMKSLTFADDVVNLFQALGMSGQENRYFYSNAILVADDSVFFSRCKAFDTLIITSEFWETTKHLNFCLRDTAIKYVGPGIKRLVCLGTSHLVEEFNQGDVITQSGFRESILLNVETIILDVTHVKMMGQCFNDLPKLRRVRFTSYHKGIHKRAGCVLSETFENCRSLDVVEFGDYTIDAIGGDTFFDCRKLSDMHVPKGLRRIECNAFSYCKGIKRVTFAEPEYWEKSPDIHTHAFDQSIRLRIKIPKELETTSRNYYYAFRYDIPLTNAYSWTVFREKK